MRQRNGETLFVAIEGTDGSGKTTIRKHIYKLLRQRGMDVLSLQGQSWLDPQGTEIITNAKFHGVQYPPHVLLEAAVRCKEVLSDRILRSHRPWRHLISDRYTLSDVVYHTALWDIPSDFTWRSFQESRILQPDLVMFVDTPPDVSWRRLSERPEAHRHPWDSVETQERLYELFQFALDRYPPAGTVIRVDNSGPLHSTLEHVAGLVCHRVAARGEATTAEGRILHAGPGQYDEVDRP